MKTTIELTDDLAARAKQLARRDGTTLRAVIERGIRLALQDSAMRARREPLRDARVDGCGLQRAFADGNWSDIRDAAYGDGNDHR